MYKNYCVDCEIFKLEVKFKELDRLIDQKKKKYQKESIIDNDSINIIKVSIDNLLSDICDFINELPKKYLDPEIEEPNYMNKVSGLIWTSILLNGLMRKIENKEINEKIKDTVNRLYKIYPENKYKREKLIESLEKFI